jgi:hypothetical protein
MKNFHTGFFDRTVYTAGYNFFKINIYWRRYRRICNCAFFKRFAAYKSIIGRFYEVIDVFVVYTLIYLH